MLRPSRAGKVRPDEPAAHRRGALTTRTTRGQLDWPVAAAVIAPGAQPRADGSAGPPAAAVHNASNGRVRLGKTRWAAPRTDL